MPISTDELEELEDYNNNTHRSQVVQFLKDNQDKGWYYISEIVEQTGLARSTVIEAVDNNQDVLQDTYKKQENNRYRFVRYNET